MKQITFQKTGHYNHFRELSNKNRLTGFYDIIGLEIEKLAAFRLLLLHAAIEIRLLNATLLLLTKTNTTKTFVSLIEIKLKNIKCKYKMEKFT